MLLDRSRIVTPRCWKRSTGTSVQGQPETAYRLASALVPFWISSKRIDDGDAWFERALATMAGSEASRARALYDHGYLVFWAGRYDVAQQRFTDSFASAERLGDSSLQALALAGSARVALNTDVDEAVRLLRRAVARHPGPRGQRPRAVQRPSRARRGAADVR